MSGTNEVGISPVLLQAISHTLTSTERAAERQGVVTNEEELHPVETCSNIQPKAKVVTHIFHEMNEPVSCIIGHSQIDTSNEKTMMEDGTDVKAMLKQKLNQRVIVKQNDTNELRKNIIISDPDVSVMNVLTALASHHLKSEVVDINRGKIIDAKISQPDVIVCYNQDNTTVPSPVNDIIVSDSDCASVDTLSKRLIVQQIVENECEPSPKYMRLDDDNSSSQSNDNIQTIYISQSEEVVSTAVTSDSNVSKGQCPICGDKVSGYHYGTYTCESCKGFFKRTVQNKKTFVCHQQRTCQINLYNRKKCPACRFAKCIFVGMKLEAIRVDRTRGGRSSYDGCSPHGRQRTDKPTKILKIIPQKSIENTLVIPTIPVNSEKESQLVAILNHNTAIEHCVSEYKKPFVPQVLTDIMNLESLLCDDEPAQDAVPEKLLEADDDMYTTLMHITEVRLYKVVRWARNLPQFTSIATDDQILLLQNCWSDLLLLECCWRSMQNPSEICLTRGKTIDLEQARSGGMEEVISKMMGLTEQLHRLQVDQYEFVGLKVLMLITPDVKGLKAPRKMREHQDRLSEALFIYTTSHYPQHPNKFGEMILRLPELSRISIIGKELITEKLLGDIASCGLLFELLKGENAAKDS